MQEQRRVTVRGILYKDGKLFGQRLHKSTGDWWCTPGGGVDPMESLHDALRREMVEETGIEPVIGRLLLIQQFATNDITSHKSQEQLEFFFLIENTDDYESVILENTSHGEEEVAEFGFVNPAEANLLPAILQTPEFVDVLQHIQPPLFYTRLK